MYRRMRPLFLLLLVLWMATSCRKDSSEAQQFITAYDNAHFEAYPYPLTHSDTLIVRNNYDGDFNAYLDFRRRHMKEVRDQYTWERAGNHLMVGPEKARQMAQELGFDHPYYFVQYLKCDTIDNPLRKKFVEGLRGRLAERNFHTAYQQTHFNTANLMEVALRYSAKGHKGLTAKRKEAFRKHYIGIDFEKVDQQIQSGRMSQEEIKMQVNKVYAAFFRAYKFLEIENGLYQWNVESGKEIGISPELFTMINGTFNETNNQLKIARLKNPNQTISPGDGKLMERKYWKWDQCIGLYRKYVK